MSQKIFNGKLRSPRRFLLQSARLYAPAIMVGYLTNLPVVFVKKKQPKTMEGMITSVVHSFTKDRDYTVCVSNSYLTPEDHVLFIDDFLANGNASKGVMDLCEKAGAKIEAMGFIIEKAFQHGGDFLRKEGIRYEALATVESLDDCKIVLNTQIGRASCRERV